jgi:hypothetical protein
MEFNDSLARVTYAAFGKRASGRKFRAEVPSVSMSRMA